MRVIAHLDPWTLETHLLDRIEEVKRGDPLAPVLVIVPTRRLADHVARRIAERMGAVVGVEILHHRALTRRILERAGVTPPEHASGALLEAILTLVIEQVGENQIRRLCRESPGSIRSLLATFRDLREAGIRPEALRDAGTSPLETIYSAWTARVEALPPRNVADDTAAVAIALPHAASFAEGFGAIFHHGAYELIGIHLDLIRAVDRPSSPLEFLTPGDPEAPVAAYAARFARRYLLSPTQSSGRPKPGPVTRLGSRLHGLYDEGRRFEPLPEDALARFSAPGARVEVEVTARRAMAAAASGVSPADQAIVARSLEPYATAVETLLDRSEGIWESSSGSPALADGAVRDALSMLHAASRDFPRAATVSILRSPFVKWEVLSESGRPDAGIAEVGSRRAGIVEGRHAWTEELPRWAATPVLREAATAEETEAERSRAEARGARARVVATAVGAIFEGLRPDRRRRFSEHARALEAFFEPVLVDGVPAALRSALADVARLDSVAGDLREVELHDVVAAIERSLDDQQGAHPRSRRGGIPWLDAKQARGLTFERVAVVGLNAGSFPSIPREDPFLSDALRERLREATGRPLSVKREAIEEERLVLALTLGAARRVLEASWQHADDTGRARTSSLALREIARLVLGVPDAKALRAGALAISAHPERRFLQLEATTGLLRPSERDATDAFAGSDLAAATRAVAARRPGLEHPLAWVRAVETFGPSHPRYDGDTGFPGLATRSIAATAAERLGRCPLQFFFRDVLGIRELDGDPEPFAVRAQDLGVDVHAWLREIYSALRDEGLLAGPVDRSARRAGELLAERLRATVPGQRASRLPVLAAYERERWLAALGKFMERDLLVLGQRGVTHAEFEVPRAATIHLADGRELRLAARLDRIVQTTTSTIVGDYKTGGNVKDRTSPSAILKANWMQAALYREIAGNDAEVEILGVGPDHAEGESDDVRATLGEFVKKGLREPWIESLTVIAALAASGRYPFAPGEACGYCAYARACRSAHPPSLKRREADASLRDFLAVKKKTTQRNLTTIAAVLGPKPPRTKKEKSS